MVSQLKQRKKLGKVVLGVCLALGLVGCSVIGESLDDTPNAGPCPVAATMGIASRVVEVRGKELYSNVGFTGEVVDVRSFCRYVGDNPIEMELEVDFALGRGPAAMGEATHQYEYFVAVTRRNTAVLKKQYFPINAKFDGDRDRVGYTEKLDGIVIPRASETVSGANFEVLVGFRLSEEELAFNRAGKRFRIDAGLEE